MGITRLFTNNIIIDQVAKVARDNQRKVINAFAYIGEEYMNAARNKAKVQGGFGDVTGNLRSSIAYGVYLDGRRVSHKVEQVKDGSEGVAAALALMDSLGAGTKGFQLIVTAGMEYAFWVEVKGYDVITGSQPTRMEVLTAFKDLLL